MKRFIFFITNLMLILCCLLTSCNTENEILPDPDTTPALLEVQTDIETATRSGIKAGFAAGDKLGLILTHENSEKIYNTDITKGVNIFSTYSANNKWEQTIYLGDSKANVYAYYPQNLQIPDSEKPVIHFLQTDQKDILYGTHAANTTSYVNRFKPTAKLSLKHATGVVEFMLKKDNYNGEGKLSKIEISNNPQRPACFAVDMYLNVVTGEIVDATEGGIPIVLQKENDVLHTLTGNFPAKGIEAFILFLEKVSQEGDVMVTFTIDNREYVWNVPVNTIWEAGYKYIYHITVQGTELVLESVIIEDYQPGGSSNVTVQ